MGTQWLRANRGITPGNIEVYDSRFLTMLEYSDRRTKANHWTKRVPNLFGKEALRSVTS